MAPVTPGTMAMPAPVYPRPPPLAPGDPDCVHSIPVDADEMELVPCLTVPLGDAKELLAACEEAEIPAALERDACCGKGGCGCAPKMQLLVPPAALPAVARLLEERWQGLLEREGLVTPAGAAPGDEPCPACGTAAPLVDGACSDCGLQLA